MHRLLLLRILAILRAMDSTVRRNVESPIKSRERQMNRRDILMAIVGSADGGAFSPVQLQKAVFLISRNCPGVFDAGSTFNFAPYDYGPFDRAVYDEANALEAAGLLRVENS